jgi:hypothetical protein
VRVLVFVLHKVGMKMYSRGGLVLLFYDLTNPSMKAPHMRDIRGN